MLIFLGAAMLDAGMPTAAMAAGVSDFETLKAAQGEANAKAGIRTVPARIIPVPDGVDSATAALAGAPYSELWNLEPKDDDGWRAIAKAAETATERRLAVERKALGVTIEPTTVGGVKAFILTPALIPETHRNQMVFHLHGGGFVFGAGESGTLEAMLIAAYGGYKVLSIDYRMPPDAPYPAAVDDAVAAWRAVTAAKDPRLVAIEGTSAGGGIALALMLRIKAEGLHMPGAMAIGTPASDLTKTGDSFATNEWVDNILVSYDGYMRRVAQLYAHGQDLKDPQLSPVYGNLEGLPPAILTTGTRDLLLSNTVRVHRKLRQAGVEADLQVYEGMSHAQYLFDRSGKISREVFGEIARFFDRHLGR